MTLQQNSFVVVSINWFDDNLLARLIFEGIFIISIHHAEAFTQHHLHIHITYPSSGEAKKPVSFLMVVEHLPRFIRFVFLHDLFTPRRIQVQLQV